MARAFVAIGSNIDPAANVRKAIRELSLQEGVIAISTVYLSEPEGGLTQPSFYNCVVALETETPPQQLKRVLRDIEARLGRVRTSDKFAARSADLDLILYDGVVLDTPDLLLPDPEIAARPFLAIPLSELAPDLALPGTGARISELAARLPKDTIRPLGAYTARLRRTLSPR